jgi:hypothetical protein
VRSALAAAVAGLLVGAAHSDPPPVSCLAQPSNTPANVGYYVGGGCPCGRLGEPRYPLEGTWGWDWSGWCCRRKVDLLWWHGRRYQGGTGAYNTDGPKLLHQPYDVAAPP